MRNSRIPNPKCETHEVHLKHPSVKREVQANQGNQEHLDTMKEAEYKCLPGKRGPLVQESACNAKADPEGSHAKAEFIRIREKELAQKRREHELSYRGYKEYPGSLQETAHKGTGCKYLEVSHKDVIKPGNAERSITLTGPGEIGRSGIWSNRLEKSEQATENKILYG